MIGFVRRLVRSVKEGRRARAQGAMRDLKVRYHTFRILLDNNERALELLNALEAALGGEAAGARSPGEALADGVEELLVVTYELADGLNRLTDGTHGALYGLHARLSRAVRQALEGAEAAVAHGPACVFLDELGPSQAAQAGGKAANLAALRRAGLPVPDGFCVPAPVCRRFLDEAGLGADIRRILAPLGHGADDARIAGAAREVMDMILAAPLPDGLARELDEAHARLAGPDASPVSVRSSALVEDRPGASFAGQFTSVLGLRSGREVRDAYRAVVAANFGPRPLSYRLRLGLPAADFGMAVLCQRMVPARAAGVLFSVDPTGADGSRMLVSAVPGLGTLAVGGEAPADIYRPRRDDPADYEAEVAEKTEREVMAPGGGLRREELPGDEALAPLLDAGAVAGLARLGLRAEELLGGPQDVEWCLDRGGELRVLQSRPLQAGHAAPGALAAQRGKRLLEGGTCASPGRAVGPVRLVRSAADLEGIGEGLVLVMHQSLVDAARRLAGQAGVVVDLGNPADHLSNVARELGVPMLTGAGRAAEVLAEGDWVVLDADGTTIHEALDGPGEGRERKTAPAPRPASVRIVPPELAPLRDLVLPLHLTDAYGPTFALAECSSLHDLVRYIHEKAVLAMFEAGDEIMDGAGGLLRRLKVDLPLHFLLIDVGGGIAPASTGRDVLPEDVLCAPFQALYRGLVEPGLNWDGPPAAASSTGGLFTRAMLDGRGERPVGSFNYGLVSRDYLNLNARLDFHFVLVDAVCGPNARENAVRFRFKGGGTAAEQRERRARCVALILREYDFMVDQRGDLVTASLTGAGEMDVAERLAVLGRLLGFSRLLDAAMVDDAMPGRVARAFERGDYALAHLDEADPKP